MFNVTHWFGGQAASASMIYHCNFNSIRVEDPSLGTVAEKLLCAAFPPVDIARALASPRTRSRQGGTGHASLGRSFFLSAASLDAGCDHQHKGACQAQRTRADARGTDWRPRATVSDAYALVLGQTNPAQSALALTIASRGRHSTLSGSAVCLDCVSPDNRSRPPIRPDNLCCPIGPPWTALNLMVRICGLQADAGASWRWAKRR